MNDRVSIGIEAGVADVRLDRADKMNALDPSMFQGIAAAIDRLAEAAGLRAVVLSGEGRAFCAGLDTSNFGGSAEPGKSVSNPGASSLEDRTHGEANLAQQVAWGWRTLPVPVIAAVHGVAFGGGFQIACGADIRIVAPDTRMSIMEIKWGLVPDMSGIAIARHLARDDVLRELCYTGRIFDGEEAQRLGFATRVSPTPYDDAMAMAREIASKNPHAIRANKRLLNGARDTGAAAVLLEEAREQSAIIRSPNQIEAVMAGMAKREPNFAEVEQ